MKNVWYAFTAEMLKEYLTTEEAAQVLKIRKTTLEQARLKGNGPRFCKFGPHIVRYRLEDIVAWGKTYSSTSEYERKRRTLRGMGNAGELKNDASSSIQ